MLHTWLLPQLPDYTVQNLVEEVRNWVEEGYVESAVWKRLQNCVVKDILPTFSEISELRQRSLSSESLASGGQSEPVQTTSTVAPLQSPQVSGGIAAGKGLIKSVNDWTLCLGNFCFLGKFLKKLGRFLFWVIFYFFWAKKPQNIYYFWAFVTTGQYWLFNSLHLATNTLHLMLEKF